MCCPYHFDNKLDSPIKDRNHRVTLRKNRALRLLSSFPEGCGAFGLQSEADRWPRRRSAMCLCDRSNGRPCGVASVGACLRILKAMWSKPLFIYVSPLRRIKRKLIWTRGPLFPFQNKRQKDTGVFSLLCKSCPFPSLSGLAAIAWRLICVF